ncbi:zinc carboxypeptidase domain-containing protein [Phthorimaea operculella]|nr:zinc carboxypeptidase domain-containing protein [Phthorimaea operculella]
MTIWSEIGSGTDIDMYWIFGIILVFGAAVGKHEIYDGYSIYQVIVKDKHESELLKGIINEVSADVWSHPLPGRPGQVLVARERQTEFQELLNDAGLVYQIEVKNVKELLELEDRLLEEASIRRSNESESIERLSFDKIHKYDEVDNYLELLAIAYPNVVSLVVGGHSFEGRPIKYLKISSTKFQDHSKPVIFIQSLIHAREWITLPVTLYAIEKLVTHVQDQDLLRDMDWIILPIANPDGYVFTYSENRLWRKNRATGYMIADFCSGVDLNRNFDFEWSAYSSKLVCSEVFHGKGPFSEPETAVIRNILRENLDRMEMFLDIHSFGSMILYGYGSEMLPPNALSLHLTGQVMAAAIDNVKTSWNPDYIVGNTAAVLYQTSGSAQDYAQSVGVSHSYTIELPGYRLGLGTGAGFLVDPKFIRQAGYETWEGIKVGARIAKENFRRKMNVKNFWKTFTSGARNLTVEDLLRMLRGGVKHM